MHIYFLQSRVQRTESLELRNVGLLRHIPKMILAKQQRNNRNYALNPGKLLSSQLLPKYLVCCSSPTFLPWGQTSSAAGWLRAHSVSISGGDQHPAGQSPEEPCLTSELALLWAKDQSTEPPVLPNAGFWGIWVLFFCSKFIRCLSLAGIFPPLCPTFYLELWQLAIQSPSLSPFTGPIITNSNSYHIWMWNLIQIWIGLSERD